MLAIAARISDAGSDKKNAQAANRDFNKALDAVFPVDSPSPDKPQKVDWWKRRPDNEQG